MKIIFGIFGFFVLSIVLCFALSNRQAINIGIWPIDDTVETPAYLVGLLPLLFGLIFGGIWGWLTSLPHRMRARGMSKQIKSLHEKINQAQPANNPRLSPAMRKKYLWNRNR